MCQLQYLEDLYGCETLRYTAPDAVADQVVRLGLDKGVRIIDVACGPGNVAEKVGNHYLLAFNQAKGNCNGPQLWDPGYTNVDGLDSNETMLGMAKKKDLYKNLIMARIVPGEKTKGVQDGEQGWEWVKDHWGSTSSSVQDTYDVLTCSAGFYPGSLVPECFEEFVRMVKPGWRYFCTILSVILYSRIHFALEAVSSFGTLPRTSSRRATTGSSGSWSRPDSGSTRSGNLFSAEFAEIGIEFA